MGPVAWCIGSEFRKEWPDISKDDMLASGLVVGLGSCTQEINCHYIATQNPSGPTDKYGNVWKRYGARAVICTQGWIRKDIEKLPDCTIVEEWEAGHHQCGHLLLVEVAYRLGARDIRLIGYSGLHLHPKNKHGELSRAFFDLEKTRWRDANITYI